MLCSVYALLLLSFFSFPSCAHWLPPAKHGLLKQQRHTQQQPRTQFGGEWRVAGGRAHRPAGAAAAPAFCGTPLNAARKKRTRRRKRHSNLQIKQKIKRKKGQGMREIQQQAQADPAINAPRPAPRHPQRPWAKSEGMFFLFFCVCPR